LITLTRIDHRDEHARHFTVIFLYDSLFWFHEFVILWHLIIFSLVRFICYLKHFKMVKKCLIMGSNVILYADSGMVHLFMFSAKECYDQMINLSNFFLKFIFQWLICSLSVRDYSIDHLFGKIFQIKTLFFYHFLFTEPELYDYDGTPMVLSWFVVKFDDLKMRKWRECADLEMMWHVGDSCFSSIDFKA